MSRLLIFIFLVFYNSIIYSKPASSARFLLIDVGARPSALGGAFSALSDDIYSLHHNPAGLAQLKTKEITFMYNAWFLDISQQYFSLALPLEKNTAIGASINYFNFGKIQRTTLSKPIGSGTEYSINNLALNLGLSKKIHDIHFGSAVKYISERIDNFTAQTFAFDLAVLLNFPSYKFSLGAAVQNIGFLLRYNNPKTTPQELPLNFKIGAAKSFLDNKLILALDINKEFRNEFILHFGTEYKLGIISLRAGYNSRNNAFPGITAGIGVVFNKFQFDYAYLPYGHLGHTHKFSLTFNFPMPEKKLAIQTEIKPESHVTEIKPEEESPIQTKEKPLELTSTITSSKLRPPITPLKFIIYFDFAQYTLKPEAIETLKEVANLIRQKKPYKVEINGHTDEIGTEEYNLKLSQERARVVYEYFCQVENLPNELFTQNSFGESKPYFVSSTDFSYSKNRRTEIILHFKCQPIP